MLTALEKLHQNTEQRKTEMLAYLESLTDQERMKQPTPSDWSPLQVMEHIVIVEEWVSGPTPKNRKVLLKGYLFMALGVSTMRKGTRVPTLPQAVPSGALNYTEIKQRWEDARAFISSKLASVTQETQDEPIALHPVAGPLTAKQILELLDAHLIYHWKHFPRVYK